jgi:heme-degrading monooxygenase HmoA
MQGGMQHIVLFHFPRDLTPDEEVEMAEQVRKWPTQIDGLTKVNFGKNMSERARGYGYVLVTEFENADAMKAYFPHPLHRVFADWVHARGSEELVADHELNPATEIL